MLSNLPKHKLPSFVIGGSPSIERIFEQEGYPIAKGMADAKIIIFQGGEDVSPYLYGDQKHPATFSNERRDKFEVACYRATMGKFRVGICRGAQFLNVMNGGWLWQHVDGHGGPHDMKYTYTRKESHISQFVSVTSTHHQLMAPKKGHTQIWGVATESTRRESGSLNPDDNLKPFVLELADSHHYSDVEICLYPHSRSLCFQPHPEYNSRETREVFFDCLNRMIDNAAF